MKERKSERVNDMAAHVQIDRQTYTPTHIHTYTHMLLSMDYCNCSFIHSSKQASKPLILCVCLLLISSFLHSLHSSYLYVEYLLLTLLNALSCCFFSRSLIQYLPWLINLLITSTFYSVISSLCTILLSICQSSFYLSSQQWAVPVVLCQSLMTQTLIQQLFIVMLKRNVHIIM